MIQPDKKLTKEERKVDGLIVFCKLIITIGILIGFTVICAAEPSIGSCPTGSLVC